MLETKNYSNLLSFFHGYVASMQIRRMSFCASQTRRRRWAAVVTATAAAHRVAPICALHHRAMSPPTYALHRRATAPAVQSHATAPVHRHETAPVHRRQATSAIVMKDSSCPTLTGSLATVRLALDPFTTRPPISSFIVQLLCRDYLAMLLFSV